MRYIYVLNINTMNTDDFNPMSTGESPIEELLSVTDSIFDLFTLQPATADWPPEVQGIAEHLHRVYKYQKQRIEKELKLLTQ